MRLYVKRAGAMAILIGAIVLIGWTKNAAAEQTFFSFTSTPGSWVGHGYLNYLVTPELGWAFTATARPDHGFVRLGARSLDPQASIENYYWDLELEALSGDVLVPGFYPGATRYPFNASSEPGLTLSGNHRGDNEVTGYFTVLEADFGSGTTVNRFAVNFRHFDEGNPNNWVDGQFRFNSLVPEPSGLLLAALALAGLLLYGWNRQRTGCSCQ